MMEKEITILILFYLVFMFSTGTFIWGKSIEKAWDFHKNMYFGQLLGEKKYYIYSKILAILAMIGATAGVIAVLLSKFSEK